MDIRHGRYWDDAGIGMTHKGTADMMPWKLNTGIQEVVVLLPFEQLVAGTKVDLPKR